MKRRIPIVIIVAIALAILLLGLHALGVRQSTAVISGIVATPADAALALIYIGCWSVTVLLSPIVVLAWGLLCLERWRPETRR